MIHFIVMAGLALAAGESVPADMQGVWAKHGRCDLLGERLTIAADRAGYGVEPMSVVHYDPEFRAVFWDEEYLVDNFVRGATPDLLIHNTQGFHMPGEEGLARCGPTLSRERWPPAEGKGP